MAAAAGEAALPPGVSDANFPSTHIDPALPLADTSKVLYNAIRYTEGKVSDYDKQYEHVTQAGLMNEVFPRDVIDNVVALLQETPDKMTRFQTDYDRVVYRVDYLRQQLGFQPLRVCQGWLKWKPEESVPKSDADNRALKDGTSEATAAMYHALVQAELEYQVLYAEREFKKEMTTWGLGLAEGWKYRKTPWAQKTLTYKPRQKLAIADDNDYNVAMQRGPLYLVPGLCDQTAWRDKKSELKHKYVLNRLMALCPHDPTTLYLYYKHIVLGDDFLYNLLPKDANNDNNNDNPQDKAAPADVDNARVGFDADGTNHNNQGVSPADKVAAAYVFKNSAPADKLDAAATKLADASHTNSAAKRTTATLNTVNEFNKTADNATINALQQAHNKSGAHQNLQDVANGQHTRAKLDKAANDTKQAARIVELEKKLQEGEANWERAKTKHGDLSKEVAQLKQDGAHFRAEAQKQRELLAMATQTQTELLAKHSALRAKLEATEIAHKTAADELALKDKQLTDALTKVTKATASEQQQATEADKAKTEAANEKRNADVMRADVEKAKTEILKIQTENRELNAKMAGMKLDIAEAREQLKRAQNTDNSSALITDLQKQIREWEEHEAQSVADYNAKVAELDTLRTTAYEMQERLVKAETALQANATVVQEFELSEQEREILSKLVSHMRGENVQVTNERLNKVQYGQFLDIVAQHLTANIEAEKQQKAAITEHETRHATLQQNVADYKTQLKEARAAVDTEHRLLDEARVQASAAVAEIERLKTVAADANNNAAQAQAATAEIAKLQNVIEDLKKQQISVGESSSAYQTLKIRVEQLTQNEEKARQEVATLRAQAKAGSQASPSKIVDEVKSQLSQQALEEIKTISTTGTPTDVMARVITSLVAKVIELERRVKHVNDKYGRAAGNVSTQEELAANDEIIRKRTADLKKGAPVNVPEQSNSRPKASAWQQPPQTSYKAAPQQTYGSTYNSTGQRTSTRASHAPDFFTPGGTHEQQQRGARMKSHLFEGK